MVQHFASSGRIPTKTASKPLDPNEDQDQVDVVQSIAVPVNAIPTVDSSKRPGTVSEEKKKPERLPWTPSPYIQQGQIIGHYKKLSKFRLSCEFFFVLI